MSALEDSKDIWPVSGNRLDSKYEKCRNITEEIYKRINITFQIKKLESEVHSELSDNSDQIDSNDLSNETDLFACDKSDSISSSTEAERPTVTCEKYININNNEETKMKKGGAVYKRPRKRFRKRVKKRQSKSARSDSECSSDEAVPLSRIVEVDSKCVNSESPDNVMGVPNIVILTRDLKPKIHQEKKSPKPIPPQIKNEDTSPPQKTELSPAPQRQTTEVSPAPLQKVTDASPALLRQKEEKGASEWKNCTMCSLSFRGERGLRRHMTMSHILNDEENKKSSKPEQRHSTITSG
ncbi:unnamed protein product [Spodoptera exigua]|nr:unnamed protein product [Spodoptera exigua]